MSAASPVAVGQEHGGRTLGALWRVLKMPWLASIRSSQGFLLLFVWFMIGVQLSRALAHGPARQIGCALLLLALAIIWKLVANTLWLARDAHTLRLPGVGRDADRALPLFALLSVVVPAIVLGAVFGNVGAWLLALALVAAATLAFCVLPTVVVLPLFAAVVVASMFGLWHPALPDDEGFIDWALPVLIALVVVSLQRWATLRRTSVFDLGPWWRPAVLGGRLLQLRRLRGEDLRIEPALRQRGARGRSCGRLNRVGPDFSVRSIRATLGRGLKPVDLVGDPARLWLWWCLCTLLVLAVPALAFVAQRHYGAAAAAGFAPTLLLWMAIGVAFNHAGVTTYGVGARWTVRSAELPLLALLPRLSAPARVRRDALLACIARSMTAKVVIALALGLVLPVLHLPWVAYLYLVLMLAVGVLGEAVAVAHVLGGKPLRRSVIRLLGWSVLLPTILTMLAGVRVTGALVLAPAPWALAATLAAWLGWCAGYAVLLLRGWRALARRAHPFMPNPP